MLPAREAMSLISPDSSTLTPSLDAVPMSPDAVEQAGAPSDATAGPVATDAQASGSGEESVSSEDRSEQISNQDTATSQT